jgi:DNA repair protein RadC
VPDIRRLENRLYRGYEVRLEVRRSRGREPYKIVGPADIYRFMGGLGNESAEHAYELLFDAQKRVAGRLPGGRARSPPATLARPEVFRAALVTNSPAFALVHNHPSGVWRRGRQGCRVAGRARAR